jgi:hypothetical protein
MQESADTQETLSNALSEVPGGFAGASSDHPDPLNAADTGDWTSDALVREPAATHEAADTQDTSAKPAPRADACPGPARAIQTPAPATNTRATTATTRSTRWVTG